MKDEELLFNGYTVPVWVNKKFWQYTVEMVI